MRQARGRSWLDGVVWAHERITLTAHSGTPMEPRPLLAGSTRRARVLVGAPIGGGLAQRYRR